MIRIAKEQDTWKRGRILKDESEKGDQNTGYGTTGYL